MRRRRDATFRLRSARPPCLHNTFLMRIAGEAKLAGESKAAFAARAAAGVLQRHITEGESVKVLHALPKHLRELF